MESDHRYSRPTWLMTACLGLLLVCSACHGEEPARNGNPGNRQAESSNQKAPLRFDVTQSRELRSRIGETVVVTGEVTRVGISRTGHRFLDFAGNREFSVYIPSKDVPRFQNELPEQRYHKKQIAVTGKLELFNDIVQISVHSPDEIQLLKAVPARPEKPAGLPEARNNNDPDPVVLKPDGKDSWISPAGLVYRGRDPDGLTRKEHVLRHAHDIPDRDGPHGVFDGGEEVAFAWIDAAWKKIEADKIRPESENGRDAYTVNMGQRIGFLGGQTGSRKGRPELRKVFIVVRQGTREIVTAFPK